MQLKDYEHKCISSARALDLMPKFVIIGAVLLVEMSNKWKNIGPLTYNISEWFHLLSVIGYICSWVNIQHNNQFSIWRERSFKLRTMPSPAVTSFFFLSTYSVNRIRILFGLDTKKKIVGSFYCVCHSLRCFVSATEKTNIFVLCASLSTGCEWTRYNYCFKLSWAIIVSVP